MRIAFLSLTLFCAGCNATTSNQPAPEPLRTTKLSAAQIKTVQDGIRKDLKDPESARFGDFYAGEGSRGLITVCGTVNAKNSYGGYTGMSPFIGQLTATGTFYLDFGASSDSLVVSVVKRQCAERGLHV